MRAGKRGEEGKAIRGKEKEGKTNKQNKQTKQTNKQTKPKKIKITVSLNSKEINDVIKMCRRIRVGLFSLWDRIPPFPLTTWALDFSSFFFVMAFWKPGTVAPGVY